MSEHLYRLPWISVNVEEDAAATYLKIYGMQTLQTFETVKIIRNSFQIFSFSRTFFLFLLFSFSLSFLHSSSFLYFYFTRSKLPHVIYDDSFIDIQFWDPLNNVTHTKSTSKSVFAFQLCQLTFNWIPHAQVYVGTYT